MLIITIAMATILAYAAHVLAGRLVGMGVTTLCSGIMVYTKLSFSKTVVLADKQERGIEARRLESDEARSTKLPN